MDPVLRKLSAFSPLEAEDFDLLHSLRPTDRFSLGRTIRTVGDPRPRLRFLVSGWAARQRLLTDGRRQILSVLLPGDLIGLHEFDSAAAGTSVVALTPCETADAGALFAAGSILRGSPSLQASLAGAEAFDQWLTVEQIVRLGRRAALERSAHFLLELECRLGLAGLLTGDRFPLPVTQEVLSDVLGLSVVHVNRTFLQLRREKWLDIRSRMVELLRKDQMASIADFQPPPFLRAAPSGPRMEGVRIGAPS
jgi:CRP-like cAMP-binding protein